MKFLNLNLHSLIVIRKVQNVKQKTSQFNTIIINHFKELANLQELIFLDQENFMRIKILNITLFKEKPYIMDR